MAKFLYTLIGILLLASAGLAALHRFENPKTRYDNYQAVVADGAISRGWIPDFLPKSATEITEQHAIDESIGYLSFRADSEDIEAMKADCDPLDYGEVKYLSSYPIWWPSELTRSTEMSVKYRFYRCGDLEIVATLDYRMVYYWRIFEGL